MKCPMQTIIPKATPAELTIDFFKCIEGECAWWIVTDMGKYQKERCVLVAIAEALETEK